MRLILMFWALLRALSFAVLGVAALVALSAAAVLMACAFALGIIHEAGVGAVTGLRALKR